MKYIVTNSMQMVETCFRALLSFDDSIDCVCVLMLSYRASEQAHARTHAHQTFVHMFRWIGVHFTILRTFAKWSYSLELQPNETCIEPSTIVHFRHTSNMHTHTHKHITHIKNTSNPIIFVKCFMKFQLLLQFSCLFFWKRRPFSVVECRAKSNGCGTLHIECHLWFHHLADSFYERIKVCTDGWWLFQPVI